MKAVVVYESLWGNTKAVAEAIADGYGAEAQALSTAEATPDRLLDATLIVAGAPVQAFSLPNERTRESIKPDAEPAPDLSAPTLRTWLDRLPVGTGRSAAFDTKIRWSPGSAAATIDRELSRRGYIPIASAEHFIVAGSHGPVRDGELDRARAWGAELAQVTR